MTITDRATYTMASPAANRRIVSRTSAVRRQGMPSLTPLASPQQFATDVLL